MGLRIPLLSGLQQHDDLGLWHRQQIKKRLELLGYQTTATTISREALRTFNAAPRAYYLVITDQTMPEMTGEKLTSKLKNIKHDIPIILCTDYSEKIDAAQAKVLGINAFLLKPVDSQELALTIRQILDQY